MSRDRDDDLVQFFGAYFHEDWPVEAATADEVLENFIRQHSKDERRCLAHLADLVDAFSARHRDDRSLDQALFRELGCYYLPEADGLSTRSWLQHVSSRLRMAS